MKKIDIRSMLVGFLACACMFLIMGQTSINDKKPMEVKIVGMEQLTFPNMIDVSVKNFPKFDDLSGWKGLKVDFGNSELDVNVKKQY